MRKGTTVQRIFIGLAIMLLFGLTTGMASQLQLSTAMGPEDPPPSRPFKVKAAGQIDLTTGVIMFGGVATHLGLYTATGFLNPDFSIFGAMEVANGDTLDFTGSFAIGPLGQFVATFNFAGGTGRFAAAVGTVSGPVTLNPTELTFLITAIGTLDY